MHGDETIAHAGVATLYHGNQQFSVTALSDSSGNVSERYAYTAYGQPTFLNASGAVQTSSAANNRYTYTGREWDSTLGLYHFRARWMSGMTGRFLTRDPIGYRGGFNMYSYVKGQPLRYIDPFGLKPGCVRDMTFEDPWRLVSYGASGTAAFTDASNSPFGNARQAMVTELTCIYERISGACYRCPECAFTPPKRFPQNFCCVACNEVGIAKTSPSKALFVLEFSANWAPSWWPSSIPGGFSITLYTQFVDEVDQSSAQASCRAVAPANIASATPDLYPLSFTVPSRFPQNCITKCP
jgi:RHS repeat-associated protein